MLAGLPFGLTEGLLLAQGIPASVLVDLIAAGLVVAEPQFQPGNEPPLLVVRVAITHAGRLALATA